MSVTITTLVENFTGEHLGLKNEHGLSFFIEKDDSYVVFDTGQTASFIDNAVKLDLPIFKTEHLVVSHGHYDHSGGVSSFLQDKRFQRNVVCHIHNEFFNKKYGLNGFRTEFLGNDFTEGDIISNGHLLDYINDDVVEIASGIHVVSNFRRTHPEEDINPRFGVLKNGELEIDHFSDEIMVVVESPQGLVLLLGCAHPGVMNMIDTVKSRFDIPVFAVLGGTHLVEADEDRFQRVAEFFQKLECQAIGVSHCTGQKWMEHLSQEDKRFFHNRTGSSLIIR